MTSAARPGADASPSAWAPLRITAFRALWLAQLGSMVGTWMQTVGAQWLLVDEPNATTLVALVQTMSMLPVLLLALPSGVIADSFDRRRWLVFVQLLLRCRGDPGRPHGYQSAVRRALADIHLLARLWCCAGDAGVARDHPRPRAPRPATCGGSARIHQHQRCTGSRARGGGCIDLSGWCSARLRAQRAVVRRPGCRADGLGAGACGIG